MRVRGAGLFLALGIAVACGGRSLGNGEGWEGTPPPAQGGSHSGAGNQGGSGGKPPVGAAGSPGHGGTPAVGAAASTGGSAAASGGTASCACLDIGCGDGYHLVPDPNNCCGSCQLDCGNTTCPAIDLGCESGMHLGTLPDECCPTCVPDNPMSCEVGRKLYADLRDAYLAKVGDGCAASGCAVVQENNRCAFNCGTPVSGAARESIDQALSRFAAMYCSQCSKPSPIPCPHSVPSCVNNRCLSGPQ